MAVLRCECSPDRAKTHDISGRYVTQEPTAHRLRVDARKAAISASEIRTDRPRRRTGSAPEAMSRRTVRVDVLKSSAVSSIVRSLLTGPTREAPAICATALDGRRCAGLEARLGMFAPPHWLLFRERTWVAMQHAVRSQEVRRETRQPCGLHG